MFCSFFLSIFIAQRLKYLSLFLQFVTFERYQFFLSTLKSVQLQCKYYVETISHLPKRTYKSYLPLDFIYKCQNSETSYIIDWVFNVKFLEKFFNHHQGHSPTKADLTLYGPGFGWATFGWASCIIVQQGSSLGSCPTFFPKTPTIIDLRVIDLVSSPVWWEAMTNIKACRQRVLSLSLSLSLFTRPYELPVWACRLDRSLL